MRAILIWKDKNNVQYNKSSIKINDQTLLVTSGCQWYAHARLLCFAYILHDSSNSLYAYFRFIPLIGVVSIAKEDH